MTGTEIRNEINAGTFRSEKVRESIELTRIACHRMYSLGSP